MKTRLFVAICAACVLLLAWMVWDRLGEASPDSSRPKGPRPVAVVLEAAKVMPLRRAADFSGALEARERFVAAPKVAGRLEALHVNIGDEVTDGQVIAELDSHEYDQEAREAEALVEVARAMVAEAQSAVDVASRELERSQRLRRQNAVSESELDQATAEYNTASARLQLAKAQVRQREAALEAARTRLSYTQIRVDWEDAPINATQRATGHASGGARVVGERFVAQGDMVDANDPIIAVATVDELLAVVYVIERDFPFVKAGQVAEIRTDAYPGRVFTGVVARVAPVLQASSRQARVEILVPKPNRVLAPGMFAQVRLTFETRDQALAVPEAALARREGVEGAFLAVDNATKARFTPIVAGVREKGWVEVTGEAAVALAGGRVVTLGKHLLEDGAAIAIPAPQTGKAGQGAMDRGKREADGKDDKGDKGDKGGKGAQNPSAGAGS